MKPRRRDLRNGSLSELVRLLASTAPEAVAQIEARRRLDRIRIGGALAEAGLDADDPLVEVLAGPEIGMRSLEVEARIRVASRRSQRFGVDFRLGGRLVHSFFDAQYSTTQNQRDRICLEIQVSPRIQDSSN